MWVFGYGSVIWRPAFEFVEALPGSLKGYTRRFWQGSPDHRGTPAQPGRVVTLVPEAGATCDGRVFQVAQSKREAVLEKLDIRESGGYERRWLEVETSRGLVEALTYIADETNPNFLGEASLDELVKQIVSSQGQSGHNKDYVLELDRALSTLGIIDHHVRALSEALRDYLDRDGGESPGR